MKSKIQALCEIALEVVERHGEGKLAGPKDSHSIMELEKFAKEVLATLEQPTPYIKGMEYKLLCPCGQNDCEQGFMLCPECVSDEL